MCSELIQIVSTWCSRESRLTGVGSWPDLEEPWIRTAPARNALAEAAAGRSRVPHAASIVFRHEVGYGLSPRKLLEMALLPATSLLSPRIRVLQTLSRLADCNQIDEWLRGGAYPRRYGGVVVDATPEMLLRLYDSKLVRSVEGESRWNFSLDRVGQMMRCNATHQTEATGRGVTVAVIDSGIDTTHPAFMGRISQQSRSFGRIGELGRDLTDTRGHGTHVAGIIGGDGSGSEKNSLSGVAPGVKLLVLKVENDIGASEAVYYAVREKADVINVSGSISLPNPAMPSPWVWSGYESELEMSLNYAMQRGVVVTVAAGNDGWRDDPGSTINAPATGQHALAVGSVWSDVNTAAPRLSSFSSHGPVMRSNEVQPGSPTSRKLLNGAQYIEYQKPDVLAPGGETDYSAGITPSDTRGLSAAQGVMSANAEGFGSNSYIASAGTSMSAPAVAGIAALIIEYARNNNLGLDEKRKRAFMVHNIIRAGAHDLGLPAAEQGFGLVDFGDILDILRRIKARRDALEDYCIPPVLP